MTESKGATIVVKSDLEISIEEVNHAVAEITKMDAVIGELEQEFDKTIFPVDTPKGMKAAKEARQKIRKPRYLIENLRKAGKAPVLNLGRKLDGKAKEQTDRLLALEDPIHATITEEEEREDREREAKIEAEVRRVEGIRARIADIRSAVEPIAWDTDSKDIGIVITVIAEIVIDETFAEFEDQANDAKVATLARLREMEQSAVAREEEEKRIAAERAELEKLRAERAKRDEAERKKREAREAAEKKKREAAEKKRREDMAEQQKKIDAENARLAEEKRKEARRQEIRNKITVLQTLPTEGYGKTAAELSRLGLVAEGFKIPAMTEADGYLLTKATDAKREAVRAIQSMLKGRLKYEAEQAELERKRKEQEEAERAAAERREAAERAAKETEYPGDDAIVAALVDYYTVTEEVAQKWLRQYGKKAKAAA